MLPKSPSEAKAAGASQYFTGKPCKHGHVAARRLRDRGCVACDVDKRRKHYHRDREAYLTKQRARQEANRGLLRAASKRWRENNTVAVKAYAAEYRAANRKSLADADRERRAASPEKYKALAKAWNERNRGRRNALTAARAAHVKRATPGWLTADDKAKIVAVYNEAARLTRETGVPHQVDHIVPLRGREVSGLHVPANLRVITAAENAGKKNKFLVELINPNPNA